MSNDKGKITDHEVSLTRRALIKVGWAVPVILSIGLPVGNIFVNASPSGSGNKSGGKGYGKYKPKKNKPKNGHGGGHGIS